MFISATNFPSKLLPQIHQNPQQQKNHDLWKSRSRARGVAKTAFGIAMLHGKHFLFWSPCSVGMRFVTFATPPHRECYFFTFAARPQREAQKSCKRTCWTNLSTPCFQKATCKLLQKFILVMARTKFVENLTSQKPYACVQITHKSLHNVYNPHCAILKQHTKTNEKNNYRSPFQTEKKKEDPTYPRSKKMPSQSRCSHWSPDRTSPTR